MTALAVPSQALCFSRLRTVLILMNSIVTDGGYFGASAEDY